MKSALKGLVKPNQLFQKLTRKDRAQLYAFLTFFIIAFGFVGWLLGFSYATGGQTPWMQTVAILPPEISSNISLVDVGHYIESNPTPQYTYGDDFNCVEDAFLLVRNANWHGLEAEPAVIWFENGSGHMVALFLTEDSGYVMVDPAINEVINPRIGGYYMGKKITEIYRMVLDVTWVPLKWEDS